MKPRQIIDFVVDNLQDVLDAIVPEPDECRAAADELLREHPNKAPLEVAEHVVRHARKWAVTMGAATGIAANPVTMLPAAIADAIAMLRIEAKMAGTIAALLDPSSLVDPDAFRRDITTIVFPGAVSQALRRIGVRAGEQATKAMIRRYASRAIMKETAQHVGKLVGVRLTQKAITTKAVPVVGAGIGAAWNFVEIQAIGRRAVRYHTGQPITPLRERVKVWMRDRRLTLKRRTVKQLPAPPEQDKS